MNMLKRGPDHYKTITKIVHSGRSYSVIDANGRFAPKIWFKVVHDRVTFLLYP